jgi:hypothetical protein
VNGDAMIVIEDNPTSSLYMSGCHIYGHRPGCGISVTNEGVILNNLFIMPNPDAAEAMVPVLLREPHTRWGRFWLAVARFCLRRLGA